MLALSSEWLWRLPSQLRRLLPCQCALCGTMASEPICEECDHQFFSATPSRCRRCGIHISHTPGLQECAACLRNPPAFDASIIATDYAAPIDQLVLALKFRHELALAHTLAQRLQLVFEESKIPTPDLLIAVPLGSRRLIDRGFNQSLEIARPLAKAWKIPLERQAVLRQRETPPQSLLSPKDRRKNILRAFTVPPSAISRIKNRHIAVVDDVMTTGATLHEVARTLKRFGAARITNLVFARALL